jgi:hypothetical protein
MATTELTFQHAERLVSEGLAERSERDFHGHRVYFIDTDYVLDNFTGLYNNSYDGDARDALLFVEDERQVEVTDIISTEGFRAPISAGPALGLIDGHARLGAALALGIARVPVSFDIIYAVESGDLALLDEAFSAKVTV